MGRSASSLVNARRSVLRAVQGTLHATGGLDRLPPRAGARVLMYHSVPPPETAPYIKDSMTPEHFERHLRFLATERKVVGIDELADRLEAGEDPEPGTVVITFDDGYRDNLDVAAPLLDRYELPATIYLATDYVATGTNQWVDRLHTILSTRTRHRCTVATGEARTFDLQDPDELARAGELLRERLLGARFEQRGPILDQLADDLEPGAVGPRLTLDWNDVRTLAARYPDVTLGVHTAGHVDLARCTAGEVEDELRRSMDAVEEATGARPRHFSFPYGRVSDAAVELVGRVGLRTAMGGTGHEPVTARSDRRDLPRLDAGLSWSQLRARTHPGFGSLPRPLTKGL